MKNKPGTLIPPDLSDLSEDIPKTVVTVPFSSFELLLVWIMQCLNHFIDEVVRSKNLVFSYVDDLHITSATAELHRQHVTQQFQRPQSFKAKVNPAKRVFSLNTGSRNRL